MWVEYDSAQSNKRTEDDLGLRKDFKDIHNELAWILPQNDAA